MAEKPDYREMQRSLPILRRPQLARRRGQPSSSMCVDNGADAYDERECRAEKRFAKDIDRLRTWGIEIAIDTGYEYRLVPAAHSVPSISTMRELGRSPS